MQKLDLKKLRKGFFQAPHNRFVEVVLPPLLYAAVDGHGDPNRSDDYARALQALYSTAYILKFASKSEGRDFTVAPLEGLWSATDPASFVERRKDEWDWTMLIMMPDFITPPDFERARAKAADKLGGIPASLRLETIDEGLCLQALHVGSYDDEGPLLRELHKRIMPDGGYEFAGPHHEIYLSDPRKTEASKLRTILRQPVRRR